MDMLLFSILLLQSILATKGQFTQQLDTCNVKLDKMACALNNKWKHLNDKVDELMERNTDADTTTAAVQSIASELQSLKQKLEDIEENQKEILEFNAGIAAQFKDLAENFSAILHNGTNYLPLPPVNPTPNRLPHDCSDVQEMGESSNGVYSIYPGERQDPVSVYCDMERDGGGWTVIQRRVDGSTNFNRNWTEYKTGFGDLQREFWLGNDIISNITRNSPNGAGLGYTLIVTLTKFSDEEVYAEYRNFSISRESENYTLSLEFVNGTAKDSLNFHNGMPFSTSDVDNDKDIEGSCANYWNSGGFWFNNCYTACLHCPYSQVENIQFGRGITWYSVTGMYKSLKATEMRIRPQN